MRLLTGNVCDIFRFERYGDRTAVIDPVLGSISYTQLATISDEAVVGLPTSKRLFVALECTNSFASLAAYFGLMRRGHVVLLLPSGKEIDTSQIIEAFGPAYLYAVQDSGPVLKPVMAPCDEVEIHPELTLLLSTSGSTGSPKLVRLSSTNLDSNARAIVEYLGITADERAITSLPFHYSYGLSVVHSNLLAGAALVLTDSSISEQIFWSWAREAGITSLAGVPYSYELMDRRDIESDMPLTVKTLTQAGGRLAPALIQRFSTFANGRGIRFFVMYGQTEATARIAYMPPESLTAHMDCIGQPIPGGTLALVDDKGATISETNRAGELVYQGDNVMLGYAIARTDLARGRDVHALHTGDIAERTEAGYFRIVGRASRFLKIFGLRLGLDDIEHHLRSEGIDAYCTGDDTFLGVVTPPGTDNRNLAVALSVRYKLPPHVVHVLSLAEIPRLANGKVDVQALRVLFAQGKTIKPRRFAFGWRTQKSVESIFRRATGAAAVANYDTFVTLGGSSLSYVEASIELEDLLGYLPDNWENMSIQALDAIVPQRSTLAFLDPDIFWRAIAIVLVIVHHAYDKSYGGTGFLLLLSGYNIGRFQRPHLAVGNIWQVVRGLLLGIVLPYYLIVTAFMVWKGEYYVSSLLFYANHEVTSGFLLPYWFLCVLVQMTVLLILMSLISPLRRFFGQQPFGFGLCAYATAVTLNIGGGEIWSDHQMYPYFTSRVAHFLALGWIVYCADAKWKQVVASALLVMSAVLSGYGKVELFLPMVAGGLMLVWRLGVPVPRIIRGGIAVLSAASLYIYLVHMVPVHLLVRVIQPAMPALACILGILCGILAWRLARVVEPKLWLLFPSGFIILDRGRKRG